MNMKIKMNENYAALKKNYLFVEIAARVKKYQAEHPDNKVIRLGIGDVTLPLAQCVVDAMKAAADEQLKKETFRGYADDGYDFLLDAIADYYADRGVSLAHKEIFVSDGAKSDCGNLVDILGDNEILIPDPVYPVYMDANVMSGRKITLLEGNRENGFLPTPDGIDGEGFVIYLCSPNNPTGAVYSREKLKKWVDFANRTGSLIIFDSAYEAFIDDKSLPRSIYEIDGARTCAIEICSLSKTAGFTGTRCGWTLIPNELFAGDISVNAMWARRQGTKFNGVAYVVQRAAAAALSKEGIEQCRSSIAYYKENARMIASLMDEKGIYYTGGISSPYIWLRCPGNMDSWEFFDMLLNKVEVVGTPGAGFGKAGEGYFRLTSFGSREATEEAVRRLRTIL